MHQLRYCRGKHDVHCGRSFRIGLHSLYSQFCPLLFTQSFRPDCRFRQLLATQRKNCRLGPGHHRYKQRRHTHEFRRRGNDACPSQHCGHGHRGRRADCQSVAFHSATQRKRVRSHDAQAIGKFFRCRLSIPPHEGGQTCRRQGHYNHCKRCVAV